MIPLKARYDLPMGRGNSNSCSEEILYGAHQRSAASNERRDGIGYDRPFDPTQLLHFPRVVLSDPGQGSTRAQITNLLLLDKEYCLIVSPFAKHWRELIGDVEEDRIEIVSSLKAASMQARWQEQLSPDVLVLDQIKGEIAWQRMAETSGNSAKTCVILPADSNERAFFHREFDTSQFVQLQPIDSSLPATL